MTIYGYVCRNTDCPEHDLIKGSTSDFDGDTVLCGQCGDPCEGPLETSATAPGLVDPDQLR